ncbi:MAG: 5'/3'-nucleotidase SurE [Actinomycetota bacterium]|nr:5'/3'-nucleotidase SurE [Actinomycetota bacterium]MEC9394388.1 5'/3'-nucleotidase SurE [Actinomycetota bacterium]MED6327432.1 5'/3'-nucleotidase SurE [Actinomycetota bacterium]MEE2957933.1 5'/3'-nucleotidase SurE [Actinomycetota bacterium]
MRVLVTNDDGISSPGLHALAAAVADAGLLPVVAAPSADWSGASACLGPLDDPDRVPVSRIDVPGLDGEAATGFSVGAPPALISMLADLGGFGPPPEMVVAGINRGPNTGRSTLFSGTIGAVLAGTHFGWSGMAVSADVAVTGGTGAVGAPGFVHWETAATVAQTVLPWLVAARAGTVLNVNAPDVPLTDLRGVRTASLAPIGGVRTVITGRDDTGLDLDLVDNHEPMPEDSDTALVRAGWATVTALAATGDSGLVLPVDEWGRALGRED